nr:lycopene cyclase domain-containing protein [Arthrobacter gengyunqii]
MFLLLASIGCMVLLDHRFRLFFFADARRAAWVTGIGLAFFLLWDLGGIGLDIFYRGETPIMLGIVLAPHLPVEEVFFLGFLCYLTMVLYGLVSLVLNRAGQQRSHRQEAKR